MIRLHRETLRDLLIEHQRVGPSSCSACGVLAWGSSFADHLLALVDPDPEYIEVLGQRVPVE